MAIRFLLAISLSAFACEALAQPSCGEQPKDVPIEVQQEIKGDVQGKAELFTKLLGDAELKGKVETSKRELYEKHQNIDKSQIDRYAIWVSCQVILFDKVMSAAQKTQLWLDVHRALVSPPPRGGQTNLGGESENRSEARVLTKYVGVSVGDKRPEKTLFQRTNLDLNPSFPAMGMFEYAKHRFFTGKDFDTTIYSRVKSDHISLLAMYVTGESANRRYAYNLLRAIRRDLGYYDEVKLNSLPPEMTTCGCQDYTTITKQTEVATIGKSKLYFRYIRQTIETKSDDYDSSSVSTQEWLYFSNE